MQNVRIMSEFEMFKGSACCLLRAAAAATAVAAVVANQGDDGIGRCLSGRVLLLRATINVAGDIHQYLQGPDPNSKPQDGVLICNIGIH